MRGTIELRPGCFLVPVNRPFRPECKHGTIFLTIETILVICRSKTGAGCFANAALPHLWPAPWTSRPHSREARTGSLRRTWIPFGQVDRERARPTAASHARAEFASSSAFPQQTIRKRLTVKPSLSCQAPKRRPVRLLASPVGVTSALASGGWLMPSPNPRPSGERDTKAYRLCRLAAVG